MAKFGHALLVGLYFALNGVLYYVKKAEQLGAETETSQPGAPAPVSTTPAAPPSADKEDQTLLVSDAPAAAVEKKVLVAVSQDEETREPRRGPSSPRVERSGAIHEESPSNRRSLHEEHHAHSETHGEHAGHGHGAHAGHHHSYVV